MKISEHDQFIEVCPHIRIYYTPRGDNHGFEATVLEGVSWRDYGIWDEYVEVEVIAKATAMFDGVRHLYLGEEGYMHYPHFENLKKVFDGLEELMYLYCSEDSF